MNNDNDIEQYAKPPRHNKDEWFTTHIIVSDATVKSLPRTSGVAREENDVRLRLMM